MNNSKYIYKNENNWDFQILSTISTLFNWHLRITHNPQSPKNHPSGDFTSPFPFKGNPWNHFRWHLWRLQILLGFLPWSYLGTHQEGLCLKEVQTNRLESWRHRREIMAIPKRRYWRLFLVDLLLLALGWLVFFGNSCGERSGFFGDSRWWWYGHGHKFNLVMPPGLRSKIKHFLIWK